MTVFTRPGSSARVADRAARRRIPCRSLGRSDRERRTGLRPSCVGGCTISASEGAAAWWAARSLLDMTEIQLLRPEGLFASPAFSQVAVVPPGATTVYVGGQNAVDQNGELVGGTDVAAQTRQVMANLATALTAVGAGIEHLVSVLVVLVQGVDVQAAYAAAAATLGAAKAPPLVSAAIVSGLGVPGAMVEVSAIAAMPDRAPAE